MVSSLSARPSIDMDERQPEQAEAFSQGVVEQSKNPASMINMEKTILERTREKSVAESRKTIQKRLEEMQKLIVPKYIQWPLVCLKTSCSFPSLCTCILYFLNNLNRLQKILLNSSNE